MSNSFNTVRISSHGSFIDKPLYIYERPENENESTNYVTFNIYFRGDIGNLVYSRCNTLSEECRNKGNKYCKSDIGKKDFRKNMEIKFKRSGIFEAKLLDCDVEKIPDLSLSIDDNDFPCGYALYNNDVPLTRVVDGCIELKDFIKKGVTLDNINLSGVLELIYNQMEDKRGTIDIYISACLYINHSQLENIITNYWQWYVCYNSKINQGYSKNIALVYKKIQNLEIKIELYKDTLKQITAIKNDTDIGFYIDVLGNLKIEEGFVDYVYQYLSLNENTLDGLGEYIDKYIEDNNLNIQDETELLNRTQSFKSSSGNELKPSLEMDSMPINTHLITHEDKLKELSDKISAGLIEQFNKQLETTREDEIRSDIHDLENELTKFKAEYYYLTMAIQTCADNKCIPRKLTRTRRIGLDNRYKPYGGQKGGKKKKKTLFKNLKKGSFTRMAKYHGYKDPMKFAQLIMKKNRKGIKKLPSGKRITTLMVKRANFAVNFGKKKKKKNKKTIKKK